MRFAACRSRPLPRTGAMVATGLPRETTVTCSPCETSRSTREKWRLASAAEIVFIKHARNTCSVEHYAISRGPSRQKTEISQTETRQRRRRAARYAATDNGSRVRSSSVWKKRFLSPAMLTRSIRSSKSSARVRKRFTAVEGWASMLPWDDTLPSADSKTIRVLASSTSAAPSGATNLPYLFQFGLTGTTKSSWSFVPVSSNVVEYSGNISWPRNFWPGIISARSLSVGGLPSWPMIRTL